MKEIKSTKKTGYLKRVLIKICRIFGYELIDQSTLDLPVSSKSYEDTLSVPGNKSISIGLGETSITRKVEAVDIIVKTCTGIQLVSQNKNRVFEEDKSEYTFRTINSLIKSVKILRDEGLGIRKIAKELKIGVGSVYLCISSY